MRIDMFHKYYKLSVFCVIIIDLLLLASIQLAYADSHGMLSEAVITEGTILYYLAAGLAILAFILTLAPYAVFFLVFCLVKRKEFVIEKTGRTKTLFGISTGFVFAASLVIKYLSVISISVQILMPDLYHF